MKRRKQKLKKGKVYLIQSLENKDLFIHRDLNGDLFEYRFKFGTTGASLFYQIQAGELKRQLSLHHKCTVINSKKVLENKTHNSNVKESFRIMNYIKKLIQKKA